METLGKPANPAWKVCSWRQCSLSSNYLVGWGHHHDHLRDSGHCFAWKPSPQPVLCSSFLHHQLSKGGGWWWVLAVGGAGALCPVRALVLEGKGGIWNFQFGSENWVLTNEVGFFFFFEMSKGDSEMKQLQIMKKPYLTSNLVKALYHWHRMHHFYDSRKQGN